MAADKLKSMRNPQHCDKSTTSCTSSQNPQEIKAMEFEQSPAAGLSSVANHLVAKR